MLNIKIAMSHASFCCSTGTKPHCWSGQNLQFCEGWLYCRPRDLETNILCYYKRVFGDRCLINIDSWWRRLTSWKCHYLTILLMQYMQLKLLVMHQTRYVFQLLIIRTFVRMANQLPLFSVFFFFFSLRFILV